MVTGRMRGGERCFHTENNRLGSSHHQHTAFPGMKGLHFKRERIITKHTFKSLVICRLLFFHSILIYYFGALYFSLFSWYFTSDKLYYQKKNVMMVTMKLRGEEGNDNHLIQVRDLRFQREN